MKNLSTPPHLSCRAISKVITDNGQPRRILDGIDLHAAPGSTTAIVGDSGAGKSSLLSILAGMEKPMSGQVLLDGVNLYDMRDEAIGNMRNRVFGYVHQFPRLLSDFTARENVAMPLILRGVRRSQALAAAEAALEQVNLGARLRHKPSELSGGEKQRVALARAFSAEQHFVLADEPSGNLDQGNTGLLMDALLALNRIRRVGIILVTHDLAVAKRMDRVLRLQDGCLTES